MAACACCPVIDRTSHGFGVRGCGLGSAWDFQPLLSLGSMSGGAGLGLVWGRLDYWCAAGLNGCADGGAGGWRQVAVHSSTRGCIAGGWRALVLQGGALLIARRRPCLPVPGWMDACVVGWHAHA